MGFGGGQARGQGFDDKAGVAAAPAQGQATGARQSTARFQQGAQALGLLIQLLAGAVAQAPHQRTGAQGHDGQHHQNFNQGEAAKLPAAVCFDHSHMSVCPLRRPLVNNQGNWWR